MKITKTKHGYSAVVYIGTDDAGKKITKRFTATNKPDLLRDIADYKTRRHVSTESKLFGDALERYLAARNGLRSASTLRAYKTIQRGLKERYAAFCGLPIDRITERSVQTVIDDLQRSGHSPKTLRNWVGLINAVLIAEYQQPVRAILPAKKIIDRPIPTEGEVRMILCLMHGHKLEIPFQLSLLGLRRGEICALELSDLDQDDILHIHRSRVMEDGGRIVTNETPKNDTSNRFIQIPHNLAEQIRKEGCVTRYTPNGLTRMYGKFLKRYKFPPYRLHDGRHFFASYCHAEGVPEADILSAGGWKTPHVMQSVYRHSMAKNRASAQVANLLSK